VSSSLAYCISLSLTGDPAIDAVPSLSARASVVAKQGDVQLVTAPDSLFCAFLRKHCFHPLSEEMWPQVRVMAGKTGCL
jgi:hypothetical protein